MSQLELFAPTPLLSRADAIELLTPLVGQDLRHFADALGLTAPDAPPKNSGWAGHTVEWLLGQPPNTHQAPDFGTWELKVTTVEASERTWTARGPIALTQFHADELLNVSFEESHLYAKTQRLLIVCHTALDTRGYDAQLLGARMYDLTGERLEEVRHEYRDLSWAVSTYGVTGLREANTRSLGVQITHADGRATLRFIARKRWVDEMLHSPEPSKT